MSSKRDVESDSSSSDDSEGEFLGPSLTPMVKNTKIMSGKKKRKVIDESLLLDNLPLNESYRYSYSNESVITCLNKAPDDSIVAAGFKNGVIKFWTKRIPKENDKKNEEIDGQLDFIKHFIAHPDKPVHQLLFNEDGSRLVSVAKSDPFIKIFDMNSLDMVQVIDLKFIPNTEGSNSNCYFRYLNESKILIGEEGTSKSYLINPSDEEILPIKSVHRNPISCIKFNKKYQCFVSSDIKGIIEYWTPSSYEYPQGIDFKYKSETDLFEIAKSKSIPSFIALSDDNETFATISYPDNAVRIFKMKSGKMVKKFDESIAQYEQKIESKLINQERNIFHSSSKDILLGRNIFFDKNDKLLIFGSISGIKILNLQTNKVRKLLGKQDQLNSNLRFNQIILMNKLNISEINGGMMTSNNSIINSKLSKNPLFVSTSVNSNKLFIFNNGIGEIENRDFEIDSKPKTKKSSESIYTSVTLHTTLGDIKIKLFPQLASKTVENFVKLCKSKYYNNVVFHRVIKHFMIQSGDPLGNGTGGESCWGGYFKDEFNSLLKHSKPFMVSMANSGPNTNGSQFFITTDKAEWLDNKHSIFGEVIQGKDTVTSIENLETDENDKPIEQVSIISTSLHL